MIKETILIASVFTISLIVVSSYLYWGKSYCQDGKNFAWKESLSFGAQTGLWVLICAFVYTMVWNMLKNKQD